MPLVALSQSAKRDLASRLALRTSSRKLRSSANGFSIAGHQTIGGKHYRFSTQCSFNKGIWSVWDTKNGKWERRKPDPQAYIDEDEPHARGAILVAAMFDAFLAIYRSRTRDLLRIATGGSGVLPLGAVSANSADWSAA